MTGKKVLIVEDAYFMRNLIKKALKEGGYEVIGEAKNGKEGITMFFDLKPDIVTMDINMPIISGIEATKQILSKSPNANIIAVTGNNDDEIKEEILRAGVKGYLQKPFQPAFLWKKLDELNALNTINENILPIADNVGIDKEYEKLEFEIRTTPDESKSKTLEIKNEEDDILFPASFQKENEKERDLFALSKQKVEEQSISWFDEGTSSEEEEIIVVTPPPITPPKQEPSEYPLNKPQNDTIPSPKIISSDNKQIVQVEKESEEVQISVPSPKRTPETREVSFETRATPTKKGAKSVTQETSIRPERTEVQVSQEISIRPPRARFNDNHSAHEEDPDMIEEPILNVSGDENYNKQKSNRLFSAVKNLFRQ